MNERDYSMIEMASLMTGVIGFAVWNVFMFIYGIQYTYPTLMTMFFLGGLVFFVSIIAYFKKRLLVIEMEQEVRKSNEEMERHPVQKL